MRFGKRSQLRLISPLGGPERLMAEAERLRAFSWTPDSRDVLATVGDEWRGKADLLAISIDTGERKRLLQGVALASMSHDGHQIAFVRGTIGEAKLYVAPVSAQLQVGEPRWLRWVEGQQFGGCAWTHSENELICSIRKAGMDPPNLWSIDTEKPSAPQLLPSLKVPGTQLYRPAATGSCSMSRRYPGTFGKQLNLSTPVQVPRRRGSPRGPRRISHRNIHLTATGSLFCHLVPGSCKSGWAAQTDQTSGL